MAETLDTTDSGNREVYLGVALADVTADYPCIVPSQKFEQLADGRRPAGQPDQTQITYAAGTVITVYRMRKDYKFEVSADSIETTTALAVGGVVVGQNADTEMDSLATAGGTEKVVLWVEKLDTMCVGGQNGATFIDTAILRVTEGR
jgi:hypothetical protein